MSKLKIALVGCGAIGSTVLRHIQGASNIEVLQVVTTTRSLAATRAVVQASFPQAEVVTALPSSTSSAEPSHSGRPDLLVECAGHQAVEQHVLPALQQGVSCLLISIGALAEPGLLERLKTAAAASGAQLHLLPGAVGGVDALAAARQGGLSSVRYSGIKPPQAWAGTPAAQQFDLAALQEATVIFEGTAREAARDYPKNANVAATVALAGLGLDHTVVRLVADPKAPGNQHHIEAQGAFGHMELMFTGRPLPETPKTSALTVYSTLRGIANQVNPLVI